MVWNVTPIFLHYSRLSDLWVNFLKKIHIKNIWADFLKNISPTGPKKSHTPKTGHRRRQVLRSSLGGDARTLLLVNLGRGETPRGSVASAVGHVFWDPNPDFSMNFPWFFHDFSNFGVLNLWNPDLCRFDPNVCCFQTTLLLTQKPCFFFPGGTPQWC